MMGWLNFVWRICQVSLIGSLAWPGLAQPVDPWAAMTQRDLQAIRDTLRANHPGPVDPQNPAYRDWLERGFALSSGKASQARSFADFERALRLYVNGFRDGHASVFFRMEPTRVAWPGFLVRRSEGDQKIHVVVTTPASGVPEGAELLSCDGRSPDQLLADRVDPYYWNADIPHVRWHNLPQLFVLPRNEVDARSKSCLFRVRGTEQTVALNWDIPPRQEVVDRIAKLEPPGEIGLRKVADMWFVTIPSFNLFGPAADPMRKLIADVKARAWEMRTGTVVFDVRGNRGGNSAWADQIAAALWGEPLTRHVLAGFGDTVDWRVSRDNIAQAAQATEQAKRDGQPEVVRYRSRARDAMAQALARGETLVRVTEPAALRAGGAPPANPVTGKVFLLTDSACFSSCLHFADTLKALPGVRQIGLPTDADTVYLDNDQIDLPSGLGAFSYSMKVYRDKVRKNNEWYEPDVRWPGGPMTDEALVRWITTLR